MSQFYAVRLDEDRCKQSLAIRKLITVTGVTVGGKIRAFSGTVQSLETGHTLHPGYPLRVTMLEYNAAHRSGFTPSCFSP